uniref:Uncharacterized protein LOC104244923 n=2 Tax=Nicotiana sylvestris TaxID=4096 RepID=A0A1U7Y3N6_NICSY|nr:PREDICTED: uncharacterized protein LOC104244923 [Nicotiana sylvestris]
MSRGIDNNNRRKKKAENDEVEEQLQAAEDDVFLKLSLNSHMARGSSTQFIDPDLDQRFRALKSKQTPKIKNPIPQQPCSTSTASDVNLFPKFAALKSSLPAYSSSANQQAAEENEEADDEVEKVIKRAIDAARLDPSPPSDTDEDENSEDVLAKRK